MDTATGKNEPVRLPAAKFTWRNDDNAAAAETEYIIDYEPTDNTPIAFFEKDGSPGELNADWALRLKVLAAQCRFFAPQKDVVEGIFRDLNMKKSAVWKRRTYSVYTAFLMRKLYATRDVWGRVYLGWMAIYHPPDDSEQTAVTRAQISSRTLPHQLLYVCVDGDMEGRGIGTALVRHYERIVAAQPPLVPGVPHIAWARALNKMAVRKFYERLQWQYMDGLQGALKLPFDAEKDNDNDNDMTKVKMFKLLN